MLRIIGLSLLIFLWPQQFCFAKQWHINFGYFNECPFVCNKNRPGYVVEVLQLIFEKISDRYNLIYHIEPSEQKLNEKMSKGWNQITLRYDKSDKQYLYTDPIGKTQLCYFGINKGNEQKQDVVTKKLIYKKASFYDYYAPDFYKLVTKNTYYFDGFKGDSDTPNLFYKVATGEYDWLLSFMAIYNHSIRDKDGIYRDLKPIKCLAEVNLYLAIDKGYLRSWEIKTELDDRIPELSRSKDFKALSRFYKVEVPEL